MFYVRGRTIKFANSPPRACRGSTGKKALVWFDDVDISAFHICVVVDLFLSGVYYCLRVFWYDAARMSVFELREQRTNIKFLDVS